MPNSELGGWSSKRKSTTLLLVVAAAALLAAGLIPPIAQDPGYHDFADKREIWGVPNFWNVVSNFPFLVVGILGVYAVVRARPAGLLAPLRPAYLILFLGMTLVAVGSGYYHLMPSNQSLVWDRLPMTLGFMAFFSAMVGEYISAKAGKRLLGPLLGLGLLSVMYWHITETQGAGDLRLYGLVQFLPLLLTPLILLLFDSPWSSNFWIWAALAAYVLSKAAEVADTRLFQILGGFSGHSIKHLLAALGGVAILGAVLRRRLL